MTDRVTTADIYGSYVASTVRHHTIEEALSKAEHGMVSITTLRNMQEIEPAYTPRTFFQWDDGDIEIPQPVAMPLVETEVVEIGSENSLLHDFNSFKDNQKQQSRLECLKLAASSLMTDTPSTRDIIRRGAEFYSYVSREEKPDA